MTLAMAASLPLSIAEKVEAVRVDGGAVIGGVGSV